MPVPTTFSSVACFTAANASDDPAGSDASGAAGASFVVAAAADGPVVVSPVDSTCEADDAVADVVVVVAVAVAAAAAAVVVAVIRAVFVVCIVVDVRILLNLNFPVVGHIGFGAAANIVSCSVVAAMAASASTIAAATISLSDVVDAGIVMIGACDLEVVVPVSATALGDTRFSPF